MTEAKSHDLHSPFGKIEEICELRTVIFRTIRDHSESRRRVGGERALTRIPLAVSENSRRFLKKPARLPGGFARPPLGWLFSALAEAGLPAICVETRHMKAVLKAQINKTDRNDARGIAQGCATNAAYQTGNGQ